MPEAAFSNRQMSTLPQLRPIIDLVSIQDALPQRVRVYGIRDRRDLDLVLSVCVCVCVSRCVSSTMLERQLKGNFRFSRFMVR